MERFRLLLPLLLAVTLLGCRSSPLVQVEQSVTVVHIHPSPDVVPEEEGFVSGVLCWALEHWKVLGGGFTLVIALGTVFLRRALARATRAIHLDAHRLRRSA